MNVHVDALLAREEEAQRLVLSCAYYGDPTIFETVPIDALDADLHPIARLLRRHCVPGERMTEERLRSLCAGAGIAYRLERWIAYPVSVADATRAFAEARSRRDVFRGVTRAVQMIETGVDPLDAALPLGDVLARTVSAGGAAPVKPLAEILGMWTGEPEWVIPGLLANRERVVITGVEGYGKSVLLVQLGLCAAWGLHPFDATPYPRQRVLVLDVENTHETQFAHLVRTVRDRIIRYPGVDPALPDFSLITSRTIDLLVPAQRARFLTTVREHAPDLLVMGSAYKMAGGDFRESAAAIFSTIDQARAETGCAILLEAHTGHGFQNDRNGDMRPDGSSQWRRWPEFGFGLKPEPDAKDPITGFPLAQHARLTEWRGSRSTGREWPKGLRPGSGLPWVVWEPVN